MARILVAAMLLAFTSATAAAATIEVCPNPADRSSCITFKTEHQYELWQKARSAELAAEAKRLGRKIYEIAAVILKAQLADKSSYLGQNPMRYYLSVMGRDPPSSYLNSLTTGSAEFLPASAFARGRGMLISFSRFKPISDHAVRVQWSTYCGGLCATGNTAVVKQQKDGHWTLVHNELNWISRAPAKRSLNLTVLTAGAVKTPSALRAPAAG